MNKDNDDLITTYMNYIYALQIREEYGDKYGDTDFIIKIYEKKLGFSLTEKPNSRKLKK